MKKILIPTLFVLLAACSGEKAGSERVAYSYASTDTPSWKISNDVRIPCSASSDTKQPCAAIMLKEGAKTPKQPLTSTDDLLALYIYDPALQSSDGIPWTIRYNCEMIPNKKDEPALCLNLEEANQLLAPFVK